MTAVPQCLVRLRGEVKVEPDESLVVGGDEDVVTRWVNCHGGYPLHSREQLLHQLLLCQVVHSNIGLSLARVKDRVTILTKTLLIH